MAFDVLIIGGGAIGVSAAYELARRGCDVCLIEQRTAVGAGASFGTSCLVTVHHAELLPSPESLREAATFVRQRGGPLAVRIRPGNLAWLCRFAYHSLQPRRAATAITLLRRLCAESTLLHHQWAAELETGLIEAGVLDAYRTRAALERYQRHLALQAPAKSDSRVLDAEQVAAMEPSLRGVVGGVLHPREAHIDSEGFCQRVAAAAAARGVQIRLGVEAIRLRPENTTVLCDTTAGPLRADIVVVATGVDAPRLAGDLHVSMPVRSAKGYHVEYTTPDARVSRPVYLYEARVVTTPLTGRIRFSSGLEFGTEPGAVNQRLVKTIIRAAEDAVKGIAGASPGAIWRGSRPVSADGLPIIGRARRQPRVVFATGHATLGITLAPITAHWVAAIVAGEPTPPDISMFDPNRFRL